MNINFRKTLEYGIKLLEKDIKTLKKGIIRISQWISI